MESLRFINAIETQKITPPSKPRTYFAYDTEDCNARKVVRGPFQYGFIAEIPIHVSFLKQRFCPDISLVGMEATKLVMEHRPDFLKKNKCGGVPFLVVDDLFTDLEELPTNGNVIDWNGLRTIKHVDRSIYTTDPVAAAEFVKHVLLSWVIGTGGSGLDYHHFIHDTVNHKVYQVPHESMNCFSWSLESTKVACPEMQQFIEENWANVFADFGETLVKNSEHTKYHERAKLVANIII